MPKLLSELASLRVRWPEKIFLVARNRCSISVQDSEDNTRTYPKVFYVIDDVLVAELRLTVRMSRIPRVHVEERPQRNTPLVT